ncbi:HutD-family protein [Aureimonas endophytica]|uniref:HutD-family protein n=1 Tax=Aureimonas endophytica TaxID=2027858 RepID=A0A917E633_9HYPH|nr:HutD family protein [Aureimonas endophytica]GGE04340.1 HutD-family protein [Aureimonas endophytica]
MRVLRSVDHRRMAWKNGGGETVEIAVHPAEADLAGFDWRVSMAHVASDGPFSRFPGIDRTLAILSGAGLRLDIDGLGRHDLAPGDAPLAFPADVATTAVLKDGPITDLNVMTRRGALRHRVERRTVADALALRVAAPWILLLPRDPLTVTAETGIPVALAAGDALLLEGDTGPLTLAAERAALFVVTIEGA